MNIIANRPRLTLTALAIVAALVAWFATPMIIGTVEFNGIPAAQEEVATDAPSDAPSQAPTEAPDITVEELLGALPLETYQVFLARDPFQPVIPIAVEGDGSGGGTGGDGGDGGGDGGDGGDGGTGGDPVDPNDETCNIGSNSATCEGLTVTLLDVQGDKIIVQVDDTLYEVTVGSVFAGSFEVMSITAPCADLLFGDDMFTLCEGDRVLK